MYSQAEIQTAFNEETGDASSLATVTEITRWFNDGQARLGWWLPASVAISWAEGDQSIATPNDLATYEEIVYDESSSAPGPLEQRGHGAPAVIFIRRQGGAAASGTGLLLYGAFWPDVTGAISSSLPRSGDAACLYYALSRFFKKLASNRTLFKRYATLLGQNAVSVDDLNDLADQWYQDFIEAKDDLPPLSATTFYG